MGVRALVVLKKGSRGLAVAALQFRLTELGFDPHGIDRVFGARTEAAVKSFQRSRGLDVDGIVGLRTQNALYNDVGMIRLTTKALAQVGKRYIFGHEVKLSDPFPRAFDCSELVQWLVYQVYGRDFGDGSANQYANSHPVAYRNPLPGDLVFQKGTWRRGISHVGVYVGNSVVVEAKGRLWGVVKTPFAKFARRRGYAGLRRFNGI